MDPDTGKQMIFDKTLNRPIGEIAADGTQRITDAGALKGGKKGYTKASSSSGKGGYSQYSQWGNTTPGGYQNWSENGNGGNGGGVTPTGDWGSITPHQHLLPPPPPTNGGGKGGKSEAEKTKARELATAMASDLIAKVI